jgi:hypothetical protein
VAAFLDKTRVPVSVWTLVLPRRWNELNSAIWFGERFMQSRRSVSAIAITVAFFGIAVFEARGDGPGTLLHWNSGKNSDEGGSDLDKPLETDRPDFTESAKTVGRGVVQLEGGYTFSYDNENGVRTADHSFPETLLRIGVLADWFELRADWNYEVLRTKTGGTANTDSGADDLTLGLKIALTPQQSCLPETGIILQMSVPTGADAFSADEVLPGVEYCYAWDITKNWSLAGLTAMVGAVDDVTSDTYSEFEQSLSLGYSWNEKIRNYTEWYVLSPISADTNRPQYYFNGGFTVLINNDVQWDIRAGVGLNEAADNFFAGTGLSLRYF